MPREGSCHNVHARIDLKAESESLLGTSDAPSPEMMTISSTGRRKLYIVGGVVVGVVVVALALGLGLGLGLKKRSSSNYVTSNSTFLLDPSFDIVSTPTIRYYEWVVEEMSGAPYGFERTMLVVNGERLPK